MKHRVQGGGLIPPPKVGGGRWRFLAIVNGFEFHHISCQHFFGCTRPRQNLGRNSRNFFLILGLPDFFLDAKRSVNVFLVQS